MQPSMKATLFFLLAFLVTCILILGVPILCTILILNPKMPNFSLQNLNIQSYKFEQLASSHTLVVSSVFDLRLTADNPNRVGLSYESCRFHVLSQGLVVGLIRIPEFHQPPLSKNVSVQTRALFECVNVSAVLYKGDGIRILGDVRAQVKIFNITLPKIKVALDCGISVISPAKLAISNELFRWDPNHLLSVPLDPQTVSKKCSLAILV